MSEPEVHRDEATRSSHARDFGGIVTATPAGVARPETIDDVLTLMKWALARGLTVTPRGGGQSQSGQSLSEGGIVMAMEGMRRLEVDLVRGRARCGPGVRLRELLAYCTPAGWSPPVVPLNLDLTVGGVLSAGGVGSSSHGCGPAIEHIESVVVVTGEGERVEATPQHNRALFDAVLGGAGRCAVLCEATFILRRAQPSVRTYSLLFADFAEALEAQRRLTEARCTHLEGFATSAMMGTRTTPGGSRRAFARWFHGIHVSFEYAGSSAPELPAELPGSPEVVATDDDDLLGHAARYDLRFQAMRATGADRQLHPWFEALIPLEAATALIPELLQSQPPWLGDGHRETLFADRRTRPFFATPGGPAIAFTILPLGVPEALREPTLQWLTALDRRVHELGGKRYLSGWLPDRSPPRWRAHFGESFDSWQACKRRFDPRGCLSSRMFAALDAEPE
ncbi:MAG: FAD-binding oxidoreductase [Myxococcota bacterium]